MIEMARQLPGRVIVPDDPTLALAAFGRLDRSLDAELDATVRRDPMLKGYIADWLRSADWVIRSETVFNNLTDHTLYSLGYVPMRWEWLPFPTHGYDPRALVWKKATPEELSQYPKPRFIKRKGKPERP
jgi:hypothetical protein